MSACILRRSKTYAPLRNLLKFPFFEAVNDFSTSLTFLPYPLQGIFAAVIYTSAVLPLANYRCLGRSCWLFPFVFLTSWNKKHQKTATWTQVTSRVCSWRWNSRSSTKHIFQLCWEIWFMASLGISWHWSWRHLESSCLWVRRGHESSFPSW